MQKLDELKGADELLSAHLLWGELGGRGRDEGEAIGDVGEAAADGKAGESATIEELGKMSLRGLVDLLRHGEVEERRAGRSRRIEYPLKEVGSVS